MTLSGGEPFLQATALIHFVQKVKKRHLHVMIYSGYTFEEILELGDEETVSYTHLQKDLDINSRSF